MKFENGSDMNKEETIPKQFRFVKTPPPTNPPMFEEQFDIPSVEFGLNPKQYRLNQ